MSFPVCAGACACPCLLDSRAESKVQAGPGAREEKRTGKRTGSVSGSRTGSIIGSRDGNSRRKERVGETGRIGQVSPSLYGYLWQSLGDIIEVYGGDKFSLLSLKLPVWEH